MYALPVATLLCEINCFGAKNRQVFGIIYNRGVLTHSISICIWLSSDCIIVRAETSVLWTKEATIIDWQVSGQQPLSHSYCYEMM